MSLVAKPMRYWDIQAALQKVALGESGWQLVSMKYYLCTSI